METYSDIERNNKIREKLIGVPKSEEHAQKCRENGSSDYDKMRIREELFKIVKNQQFSLSSKL